MLACEGLHVRYGRLPVLHDVSLRVERGELVAVLGPNGAGKTTLLRTIVGLLAPAAGRVTFEGRSLVGRDPALIVGDGVALVPQGRMLFQSLTVRENLRLGAYRAGDGAVAAGRLEQALTLFPVLGERLAQPAGTLSGGQQQMLAIARALMSGPRLLLLDEPSTGLAPLLVESIFRALAALHRAGTMVLLVEQNVHVALDVASRAYVLEHGSIVAEGPAATLRTDDRVMAAYLG